MKLNITFIVLICLIHFNSDLLSQEDDEDIICYHVKYYNNCSSILNQNNKLFNPLNKDFIAIQNNTNFDSKSIENFTIANFPSVSYGLSNNIELIAKIDNTLNLAYQNEANFKYQSENQFLIGTSIYSNFQNYYTKNFKHNFTIYFNPKAIINNQFKTMIGNLQYRYNILLTKLVISPYMNFIANRNVNSIELINNYGLSFESPFSSRNSIFSIAVYGYSSQRYRNLMELQIAYNIGLIEFEKSNWPKSYMLDLGITLGTGLNSASRGYFGNISLSYYLDL